MDADPSFQFMEDPAFHTVISFLVFLLAAGVLDDNQVEELEALIDAYYEALEASTDDPSIDDEPTDEPTEQTAETDAQ